MTQPSAHAIRLNPEAVSWREVEHEVVLLDERTWKYVHLNPSASLLWRTLVDGATREQLIAALAAGFPDAGAEVDLNADVDAFLDQLRERGYLADA